MPPTCSCVPKSLNVADIAIYEEKALQPYYKIVMKDGEVKYFTVAEMNEIKGKLSNISNKSR